ncbi:type VI secretion system baseplate subunit TssF [Methyloglobulus sp.]|uniref:type VI secretion system baseplate subunit TssF n=1 Tax=Methyloglobulus sp. TaxID=2518622 RepID=UPI003988D906
MNPQMIEYYQRELRFIREMGMEFANQHPKIAAGLDIGRTDCADPYVERLLEGFAFLTARIQLKMDAEFPRFTQHLLEMVYPHYLAPLPSMTVVQFKPDLKGGVTEAGFVLPKHTRMLSNTDIKGRTKCEFRTAHELKLWPLQLIEASYLPLGLALRYADSGIQGVKSAIRLRLETVLDMPINSMPLESLPIYLHGIGALPSQLYELIFGHNLSIVIQPAVQNPSWREKITSPVQPLGFAQQDSLLPYLSPSFNGYRLLQEYFAIPERFLFFELINLQSALRRCNDTAVEIVILLNTGKPELEDLVNKDNFALYCTPAINLFPKRADRIHLNHRSTEHQVIVDRTAQSDFEVHTVTEVAGYGSGASMERVFLPFYTNTQESNPTDKVAYYTVRREHSLASGISGAGKLKAPYLGSEVLVSLVDSSATPFRSDLKQLGVNTLCTNRDLPMLLLLGEGDTDFTLEISAPLDSVRCLAGPTDPKPSHAEGQHAWRLLSHLSLNYLSLIDHDDSQGADGLRDLLRLYADYSEPVFTKQIDGVLNVESRPVVLRIPVAGPMCFGRGLEITITFDESAFAGIGCFLLAAVLERFISKYVSINSFTQVLVKTRERGEIMRWPVRTGTRTLI